MFQDGDADANAIVLYSCRMAMLCVMFQGGDADTNPVVLYSCRMAMLCVMFQGGDADANAAVAGAMLGCKLGLSAIPHSWIESLTHRRWLDGLIEV